MIADLDLAAHEAQLDTDGWCAIPDVLPPSELRQLRLDLESAITASAEEGVATRWRFDPNELNVRVSSLVNWSQRFRDLLHHPLALAFAHRVLGPSILLSNYSANIAKPGSGSMALHSDQVFSAQPWERAWGINIGWPLDDSHADNGATRCIPGSHRWTTADHEAVSAEYDYDSLLPLEADAGSLVVMDSRLWHTAGQNQTLGTSVERDRAVIFAFYVRAEIRPNVNWNASLLPEVEAQLDADTRALLGLDHGAIGELVRERL